MAMGLYKVKISDDYNAGFRWITVQATTREHARYQVVAMGENVVDVQLVSLMPDAGATVVRSDSEFYANLFAWLGFLAWPFGIAGLVMANRLIKETNGRMGNYAHRISTIALIIQGICVFLLCAGLASMPDKPVWR